MNRFHVASRPFSNIDRVKNVAQETIVEPVTFLFLPHFCNLFVFNNKSPQKENVNDVINASLLQ